MHNIVADDPPSYRTAIVSNSMSRPMDWHDVVELAAYSVSGKSIQYGWKNKFFWKQATLVSWSPGFLTFFSAVLKRRVIYLCWGIPKSSKGIIGALKMVRLRMILRRSEVVLVNEKYTQCDVYRISNRSAEIIPYVVDPEYFKFVRYEKRHDYILVPGNNDRDEELVIELARRGLKIIRMTRDRRVMNLYRDKELKNISLHVRFGESIDVVRRLYQQARVVVLPVLGENHAAGQTSVLEALSCGAPIVLSEGRASSIVENMPSVGICKTNAIDEWLSKINQASQLGRMEPDVLLSVSNEVGRIHAPAVLADKLAKFMRNS